MATLRGRHVLSVSSCPVSGGDLLEKVEGIVRTNSVSTVQMAHKETQFAPRRYSNRGRQEHAKRRLLLGACERGVSRTRWKSAKSGYSAQELSNWGEGSRLPRCKTHCSLESSASPCPACSGGVKPVT